MNVIWAGGREPQLRKALSEWTAEQVWPGRGHQFGNSVCMGIMDGEKLAACMVFHNWSPEAQVIEISGASRDARWLRKPVLWAMFDYPFNTCGCQMVVMRVSAFNVKDNGRGIHRILRSYGFTEVRIPRLRGRDEDEIIFTLTDDAWRANGFHREHSA